VKTAKIIVHCLVQNEGRFIWYAVNSVLPFVDKIMVWDMGSIDGTWEIISSIESDKLEKKRVAAATSPDDLTKVRQLMIETTPKEYTWLMILDGDEIWPEKSIQTITEFARNNPEFESIVIRTHNLVGDIYHTLPWSSGRYQLAGQRGHLNLRFMNLKKISGLHIKRPHGSQGYFDAGEVLVQERDPKKIKFFDFTYHHATHLPRSLVREGDLAVPKRKQKIKYELGSAIPSDEIPEVFFEKNKPALVPDLTVRAPLSFWIISALLTPPRRLKRFLFKGKDGY